jgi:hypothetical protein
MQELATERNSVSFAGGLTMTKEDCMVIILILGYWPLVGMLYYACL